MSIIKTPAVLRETDENYVKDPRRRQNYTKKEKILNFMYYYKWWIVLAAVLAAVLFQIIYNALGIGQVKADYTIACVTETGISEEIQKELEEAFALLGEDLNGDGEVKVVINQYLTGNDVDPENSAYYSYASDIKLQAAWWLLAALFMPWTAFLVPILGVWYIMFLSFFILYDRLNEAFEIEKSIEENFPGQIER